MKSQKGFGHFELFWVLLAIISATFGIRFGGWILGVDIGWAVCIFLGLISLVALVVVIGVIVSVRESPPGNVTAKQDSAGDEGPGAMPRSRGTAGAQSDQCVRVLQDEEGKRRVKIFLRATGTFYFQEERFSDHALEQCWVRVSGRAVGFYDSETTALREAKAGVDWLIAG